MAAPAVVFERVWKKFRRGERHDSLRDLIPSLASRAFGRQRPAEELREEEFWAVRDVSFEVHPGEALGIIGPNGAGKSTTLKLLSKILKPTTGRCEVRGRMGALIEVTAGFHPDLTGRENIYLQGAIMGMKRAEIAHKFDEVVSFAGVDEFIDTQVKKYSSGMQARLGFSVAAHLEPQVLLIDEVLSVGDIPFQERCMDRMRRFRDAGTAIVFISHNLAAIAALCERVLVLSRGEVQTLGPALESIGAYSKMVQLSQARPRDEHGAQAVVELLNLAGQPTREVNAGDQVVVRATVQAPTSMGPICCGVRFRSIESGTLAFSAISTTVGCEPVELMPSQPVEFVWTLDANLARGHYSVEFLVFAAKNMDILCRVGPGLTFTVNETLMQEGTAFLRPRCAARRATEAAPAHDGELSFERAR